MDLADAVLAGITAHEQYVRDELYFGYMRMTGDLLDDLAGDRRRVEKHRGHGNCRALRKLARRYDHR